MSTESLNTEQSLNNYYGLFDSIKISSFIGLIFGFLIWLGFEESVFWKTFLIVTTFFFLVSFFVGQNPSWSGRTKRIHKTIGYILTSIALTIAVGFIGILATLFDGNPNINVSIFLMSCVVIFSIYHGTKGILRWRQYNSIMKKRK